jgi:DNA polymerase-1
MNENSKNTPILIIDGYGFVYRAYHVQPPLTAPDGQPVGAIYGLTSMLIKLINDFKPQYAVIVLDSKGKNFRHHLFEQYKANRPPAPDDLVSQLPIVRDVARALNFCVLEKEGFEADDIIATIATKCANDDQEAIIISADKDLLQLMNAGVKIYDPSKSKFITENDVLAKFGVLPNKVREVQALMGDSSDNIPGVKGVGPKTASELINNFGNLETLYASLDQVKNPRWRDLLSTHKTDALLSWQLVGLSTDVKVDQDINSFIWNAPPAPKINEFIAKYGFKSLSKRVENLFNHSVTPASSPIMPSSPAVITAKTATPEDQDEKEVDLVILTNQIESLGIIGVAIEEKDSQIRVIFSIAGKSYVLNYEPHKGNFTGDLFAYSKKETPPQSYNKFIEKIFADPSIQKITFDLKKMYKYFTCELNSFDDLSLMDYCLNAGMKNKTLEELVAFCLTTYFPHCYDKLKAQLFAEKTLHLYETIDLPLCHILHQMEQDGIKIDVAYLQKLSNEFGQEITLLEQEIFKICGEEFNISSPKQLGEILFDKLKLPFAKISGKSKTYATGVEILEKLSEDGHPIADLVLKYRHLTKLKNTYTETLPKQANKTDHRIHTTFLQTSTTTGRLSSIDPNVQNIPVRTPEGNKIRRAFIASDGHKLISADYSQIELRILSHVANIPALKQAFIDGKDIHMQTASQIFGVQLEKVTPDLRYKAKAINFGIIYGISGFGLARNLGISRKEASDYIAKYFHEYPGIERYMAETIAFAQENLYVENLLGRRCYVPMINNQNHALRSFAQRAAINAPMQSLTADIAKMAMIAIDKKLHLGSLKTKMMLQIHDELVFEAPISEVEQVTKLIKSTMEHIITLDVPTKVDVACGDNWQEI